jgi:predicted nucleic-acid-binding Zn-ribbon protein
MKSGVCPKCGSKEVYRRTSDIAGNNQHQINIERYKWAAQDYFVCVTCGYLETYIFDEKGLGEIARRWHKVDGKKGHDA